MELDVFFISLSDGFQDKNKLGKYKGIPCDKGGANEEIIKWSGPIVPN